MGQNNDYKYILQDFNHLYIGCRWTYQEMLEEEDMPFKWKVIASRYLSADIDKDTTLENHIFFLTEKDFAYQTLRQLKAVFKINVWVTADGKKRKKSGYVTKEMPIEEFVKDQKIHDQMDTVIVQELRISKLALMVFSV